MIEEDQGFAMQQSIGNMINIVVTEIKLAIALNIQHTTYNTYLFHV